MKRKMVWMTVLGAAIFVSGCASLPPGAEPGPDGTMAYDVLIEASQPGAKVEANGEIVGTTPLHLKVFGDRDGTFHDFGSEYYVINALPLATNQYAQTRVFGTGKWFGPEDRIPRQIHFDMNQPPPAYPPPSPVYVYPGYPPPAYYGPRVYFYGGPRYYHHHGGGFRVYSGPGRHRH
jgi:hypothetical protein